MEHDGTTVLSTPNTYSRAPQCTASQTDRQTDKHTKSPNLRISLQKASASGDGEDPRLPTGSSPLDPTWGIPPPDSLDPRCANPKSPNV